MIITNEYFKGEIYISVAKPSLTAENTSSEEFKGYVEQYSFDCFVDVFGAMLAEEFAGEVDETQTNLLKVGADAKWDNLLNGQTYVDPEGNTVRWRGIRFRNVPTETYKSLVAFYIYFQYKGKNQTSSTANGEVKAQTKNSIPADANPKIVNAYNKFLDFIQPKQTGPTVIYRNMGIGLDYYNAETDYYITLSRFIKDANLLSEDTYANYAPKVFGRKINSLGI